MCDDPLAAWFRVFTPVGQTVQWEHLIVCKVYFSKVGL